MKARVYLSILLVAACNNKSFFKASSKETISKKGIKAFFSCSSENRFVVGEINPIELTVRLESPAEKDQDELSCQISVVNSEGEILDAPTSIPAWEKQTKTTFHYKPKVAGNHTIKAKIEDRLSRECKTIELPINVKLPNQAIEDLSMTIVNESLELQPGDAITLKLSGKTVNPTGLKVQATLDPSNTAVLNQKGGNSLQTDSDGIFSKDLIFNAAAPGNYTLSIKVSDQKDPSKYRIDKKEIEIVNPKLRAVTNSFKVDNGLAQMRFTLTKVSNNSNDKNGLNNILFKIDRGVFRGLVEPKLIQSSDQRFTLNEDVWLHIEAKDLSVTETPNVVLSICDENNYLNSVHTLDLSPWKTSWTKFEEWQNNVLTNFSSFNTAISHINRHLSSNIDEAEEELKRAQFIKEKLDTLLGQEASTNVLPTTIKQQETLKDLTARYEKLKLQETEKKIDNKKKGIQKENELKKFFTDIDHLLDRRFGVSLKLVDKHIQEGKINEAEKNLNEIIKNCKDLEQKGQEELEFKVSEEHQKELVKRLNHLHVMVNQNQAQIDYANEQNKKKARLSELNKLLMEAMKPGTPYNKAQEILSQITRERRGTDNNIEALEKEQVVLMDAVSVKIAEALCEKAEKAANEAIRKGDDHEAASQIKELKDQIAFIQTKSQPSWYIEGYRTPQQRMLDELVKKKAALDWLIGVPRSDFLNPVNVTKSYEKAIDADNIEAINILVKAGANMECMITTGKTALHYAAERGKYRAILSLLNHRANVNAQGDGRKTPLHLAIENNQLEAAKMLVRGGANVDMKDGRGISAFASAMRSGNNDAFCFLRDAGAAPIACEDAFEWFEQALHANNPEIAKKILQCTKFDINKKDSNGETLLSKAVITGNISVVAFLLSKNANPAIGNLLHLAMQTNQLAVLDMLIENNKIDRNSKDGKGRTPLHLAIEKNLPDHVKKLIAKGADPNVQDNVGFTSLHTAATMSDSEMVKILLPPHSTANIEAKDHNSQTPLHVATRAGSVNVVITLLEAGANYAATTSAGKTAENIANDKGYSRIRSILRDARGTWCFLQ